jgi:hypothetical protein
LRNATLFCEEQTVITEQNSKNIVLDNIHFKTSEVFMKAMGERSKNIAVMHTDFAHAGKGVELGANVSKDAVTKK